MKTLRQWTAGVLPAIAYGAKWAADRIDPQDGGPRPTTPK